MADEFLEIAPPGRRRHTVGELADAVARLALERMDSWIVHPERGQGVLCGTPEEIAEEVRRRAEWEALAENT